VIGLILTLGGLTAPVVCQQVAAAFVDGRVNVWPKISGRVLNEQKHGVAGVMVRAAPEFLVTLTQPDGRYELSVPSGWSGFVVAHRSGLAIMPPDRTYDQVTASIPDQDFSTEALGSALVSGQVREYDGRPASRVIIRFLGAAASFGENLQTATEGDGFYQLSIPVGWTGTIRPDANHRLESSEDDWLTITRPVERDFVVYRNWYVAPTGSDGRKDGFFDGPFGTIQKAADRARPGDTILLREGLYDLTSDRGYDVDTIYFRSSGQPGQPITIQAYPGETVALTTAESKPIFDFSDTWEHETAGFGHYVFSGLRIEGGRYGWLFRPPAPDGWQLSADPISALAATQIHDVLIEDCEVDGNGMVESGIYARSGGIRNLTVRRCRFHHTIGTEGTVDIGEWRDTHPAHAFPRGGSHDLLFEDCDFHDALHQQANGIVVQPGSYNVTFRRCRAWNNGKYGFACKGSGQFRLDRCAAWGNDSSQMYCRGFGGDDDTGRPLARNDFLITNSVFVAPADQRGGAALNWRENCDLTVYHCTIVGLRDAVHDEAGGFAFQLGHRHNLPSRANLCNCIVAGYTDAPAVRFYVPKGGPFLTNTRYEGEGNLFYSDAETTFKYQSQNWRSLAEWQAYWAAGEPRGDDQLLGPSATFADASSLFDDPGFVLLSPSQAPLRKMWAADLFDPANFADVRVTPSSPAIESAENLSDLDIPELVFDYNGDRRPLDGPWTAGAFQAPIVP